MTDSPLISVIVPVYRVEAYLKCCVDSIRNQTYSNLEIILVDDGSPDNCGALCDEMVLQDSRIRVIHKPNGGLSDARNAGIDIAQGEYLGFVDSDDWIEPGMYEQLLTEALQENVKLVCGGRYDFFEETGEKKVGLCPEHREVVSGEELVRRIFTWQRIDSAAWDKLYHRSLLQTIRYPVGKIVEDVPTTYKIALLAGRAVMLNVPVYNYRHRPGSITTAGISDKVFHFPENTAVVWEHICRDHPSLKREAAYLRQQSLVYSLMMVDQAGKEARKKFHAPCAQCRSALRKMFFWVVTCSVQKPKDLIREMLLMLDLYRPVYRLIRILKRTDRMPKASE